MTRRRRRGGVGDVGLCDHDALEDALVAERDRACVRRHLRRGFQRLRQLARWAAADGGVREGRAGACAPDLTRARGPAIGAGHILLGVLQAEAGTVPRALAQAGVERDDLRAGRGRAGPRARSMIAAPTVPPSPAVAILRRCSGAACRVRERAHRHADDRRRRRGLLRLRQARAGAAGRLTAAAPGVTWPLCDVLPAGDDPGAPSPLTGDPADVALQWIPVVTTFRRPCGLGADR